MGKVSSIKGDIENFTRLLKAKEIFHGNNYTNKSIVKNKSSKPLSTTNTELNQIVTHMENLEPNIVNPEDNLSNEERHALKELSELTKNQTLVLRPADKGQSIIIMDGEYYCNTLVLNAHLNTNSYVEVEDNANKIVVKNLQSLTEQFKECLTKDEIKFIIDSNWKTSNLRYIQKYINLRF